MIPSSLLNRGKFSTLGGYYLFFGDFGLRARIMIIDSFCSAVQRFLVSLTTTTGDASSGITSSESGKMWRNFRN